MTSPSSALRARTVSSPARRSLVRVPLVGALLVTLAACGGSNVEPVTPVTDKPVAKAVATADVSPVAEPEGVVAVARVANLDASLKIGSAWAHLPLPDRDALVRSLTDENVASAVDLAQPIDGVLALKRDLRGVGAAFSAAVRSVDDAKTKLASRYRVTPAADGQFVVEGIGGESEDDDDSLACVLAPAPSGGRLVCGDSRASVEKLAPYLARTVSRETWSSALHVEVKPEPLARAYDSLHLPSMARMLLGQQGPAMSALVDGAVQEIGDALTDAQRLTFDVRLEEAHGDVDVRYDLRGKKSVVARLGMSPSCTVGSPPTAFWHLPSDVTSGGFGCASDPKLWAHPLELLGDALVEIGTNHELPASEAAHVRDLLVDRSLPKLLLGTTVYGSGVDLDAVARAKKALDAASGEGARAVAAFDFSVQKQGWHLWRTESPIADVGTILKDWAQLASRPAFAAWLKKQNTKDVPFKVTTKTTALPASAGLPKDSVHVELGLTYVGETVKGKAPPKPVSRTVHLVAVPDEGKTWFGFGADLTLLTRNAKVVLSTSPETGTLKDNAAVVAAMKDVKAQGASFLTTTGLLAGLMDKNSAGVPAASRGASGAAPLVAHTVREAPSATAPAGSFVGTIRFPRELVEAVVIAAASEFAGVRSSEAAGN